jgi:ribonuclease HI
MSEPVFAFFDGLMEPAAPGGRRNPGGQGAGGWVVMAHTGAPGLGAGIRAGTAFGRDACTTNNQAEYLAALLCLRAIYRTGWRGPVVLRGDSQLVVRQFTGEYQCGAPGLVPLLARLRRASACFASLRVEWIPREQNIDADALSRRAYTAATGLEVREDARRR